MAGIRVRLPYPAFRTRTSVAHVLRMSGPGRHPPHLFPGTVAGTLPPLPDVSMARMPHPWYRRSRGQWFTTMNGKQLALGISDPTDEAGAWEALRRIVKQEMEARHGSGVRSGTLQSLIDEWLASKRATVAPRTVIDYQKCLAWLVKAFPGADASSITVASIVEASAREAWSDTHRSNVLWTVGSFLRWCGRGERVPRPPKQSRGADSVIPEDVYRACLRESSGDFHQLLRFLWETGARPGEATALTAEVVNWESGTVTLKRHKTAHRGKVRVLYLCPAALEVLTEQRQRHKAGLLFRGLKGRKFSLQAMTMRFERLSEKVGHRVTSYQFRHTWATRALASGIPDAQVAAVLGHTSTAMIARHYGHLDSNARLLKDVAGQVSRGRQAG